MTQIPGIFKFPYGGLVPALEVVERCVPEKHRDAFMTCALLSAEDDAIAISGGGRRGRFATMRIIGDAPAGARLLIPCRSLSAALRALAVGEDEEGLDKQIVTINGVRPLRPSVRLGRSLPKHLTALDATDYPEPPTPLDIVAKVERHRLAVALDFLSAAIQQQHADSTDVKVDVATDVITMTAKNARQRAIAPVPVAETNMAPLVHLEGVIDRTLVRELLPKLTFELVEIGWSPNRMFFMAGTLRLWLPSLADPGDTWCAQEPPAPASGRIVVVRDKLLTALSRAEHLGQASASGTKLVGIHVNKTMVTVMPHLLKHMELVDAPPLIAREVTGFDAPQELRVEARRIVPALQHIRSNTATLSVHAGTLVITNQRPDDTRRHRFRYLVDLEAIVPGTMLVKDVPDPTTRVRSPWEALTAAVDAATIAIDSDAPVEARPEVALTAQGNDLEVAIRGDVDVYARVEGEVDRHFRTSVNCAELSALLHVLRAATMRRGATPDVVVTASDRRPPVVQMAGYTMPLTVHEFGVPLSARPVPEPVISVTGADLADEVGRIRKLVGPSTRPSAKLIQLDAGWHAVRFAASSDSCATDGWIRAEDADPALAAQPSVWVNRSILTQVAQRAAGADVRLGWGRHNGAGAIAMSWGQITVVAPTTVGTPTPPPTRELMGSYAVSARTDRDGLARATRSAMATLRSRQAVGTRVVTVTFAPSGVAVTADGERALAELQPAHTYCVHESLQWEVRASELLAAFEGSRGNKVTLHAGRDTSVIVVTETLDGIDELSGRHYVLRARNLNF